MRNDAQASEDVAQPFGCDTCWPASAEGAWKARRQLVVLSSLVDESHFIVRLSGNTVISFLLMRRKHRRPDGSAPGGVAGAVGV